MRVGILFFQGAGERNLSFKGKIAARILCKKGNLSRRRSERGIKVPRYVFQKVGQTGGG